MNFRGTNSYSRVQRLARRLDVVVFGCTHSYLAPPRVSAGSHLTAARDSHRATVQRAVAPTTIHAHRLSLSVVCVPARTGSYVARGTRRSEHGAKPKAQASCGCAESFAPIQRSWQPTYKWAGLQARTDFASRPVIAARRQRAGLEERRRLQQEGQLGLGRKVKGKGRVDASDRSSCLRRLHE
jgi:hypothetical protein